MFLTALVLAALTAHADPNPAPTPAPTPDPVRQIQPIRQAKAVIKIYKLSYDGASSTNIAHVCDFTTDVPVFDTRGMHGIWWSQGADVSCTSTLGTAPVLVHVNASINITDMRDPVDHVDRKYFESSLWVGAASTAPMPTGDYSARGVSAWSHDLAMHALGLDMQPSVMWLCVKPGPSKTEPFPIPDPNPPATQKLMRLRTNTNTSSHPNISTDPNNNCKPMLDQWFNATIEFQD